MHRVLYLIVQAESEKGAVKTATSRFEEDFVDTAQYTFDYCKPMQPGDTVSGSGRWHSFEGQPNAAPLTDEMATEWIEEAIDFTERHFAENLYAMFQHMVHCLEDSPLSAPEAIDQIYAFAKENHEDVNWSDGGEHLREEWGETVTTLFEAPNGAMHRVYANSLRRDNPYEGHIIDYYTYGHQTIADGGHHLENVREIQNEQPEDAWVVPLDVHF